MPGEQVLLDLNVLAGDSDYFALGAYDLAPGQDRLLYSTDHDGSEKYTMRVRDLAPAPTSTTSSPRPPTARRGRATTRSSTCGRTPRCARTRCGATSSARRRRRRRARVRGPRRALLRERRPEPHRAVGAHHVQLEGDLGGAPHPGRRPDRRRRRSCSRASRASSTTSPTRRARPTATASSSSPTSTTPSNFKLMTASAPSLGAEHWQELVGAPPRGEARGRHRRSPGTSCATSAARACAASS